MKHICIRDAHSHNLQHFDLTLPRDQLIVFTGVSGSGKSTLAFDTIFAEGQRRYVETLSPYARQFMDQFDAPAVASIEGLSPAIAIDQKSISGSPRSTVGTVTEIVDYLRVLYARIGTAHCPQCKRDIQPQSLQRIVESIWDQPEGTRVQILAPIVRGRKGDYNALLRQLRKEGVVRARIDGEWHLLDELPDTFRLDRNKLHHVEAGLDRFVLKKDQVEMENRLTQAVHGALKKSDGYVISLISQPVQLSSSEGSASLNLQETETFYSQRLACPECDIGFEEMAPRLFSFNSPYGACTVCAGLGFETYLSDMLLVPDTSKTLKQGAIPALEKSVGSYYATFIQKLGKRFNVPIEVPFRDLSATHQQWLFYGSRVVEEGDHKLSKRKNKKTEQKLGEVSQEDDDFDWFDLESSYDGIMNVLSRRYQFGSDGTKRFIEQFMAERVCPGCEGTRLKPVSLSVTLGVVNPLNIHQLCSLSISDAYEAVENIQSELTPSQHLIGHQALLEVSHRLRFLTNVGLNYLTLARRSSTLSGGEAQRIRLATQIGSGLSGVLYVLDEPSIGLHPTNNHQLIETLKSLRDQGNSLIVVEHDEDTIRAADWVVDIGPGAGRFGGNISAQGKPQDILDNRDSITGDFLSGRRCIPIPETFRSGSGQVLWLKGATRHNLKNIDVAFPLGTLIALTGLSGSGKSTLVFDLLYPAMVYHLGRAAINPEGYQALEGIEHLDKLIEIDQSPIGRSPRSNPVTYIGIMDSIRKVFAATELAKVRGYGPGRFSFNVKGGRCEACRGDGLLTLEMNFLPDAHIECEVCQGKRYNQETLEVLYQGKSIADVLEMTVEESVHFFEKQPAIQRSLQVLMDVGLGYIHLGQSSTTLSGGEAQRVKLSAELCKRSTGRTLYLMDEPTVGLHWQDLEKLMLILNRLVDQGNTVVVIEHHLDLIKAVDYVIDMGPGGGQHGGTVVAQGSPQTIADHPHSVTGKYLKPYFKNRSTAPCNLLTAMDT